MRGTPGSAKKVGGCCGTFRLWVVLLILHVNSDVCRALENDDKNDKLHRSPQLMSAQVPVGGEKEVTLHSQPVAPGFKQRPPVVTEAMLVDFLRSAEDLLENRGGWKVLSKADDCKVHTRPRAGHSSDWEYAVVGAFADLSAASYLTTLNSIPFRRAWDDSVKDLELLEVWPVPGDRALIEEHSLNSELSRPVLGGVEFEEIVYWRMALPWPVKDRDFVFARRLRAFHHQSSTHRSDGVYALVFGQKNTQHKTRPETGDAVRIQEYEAAVVAFPSNEERNPQRPGVKYVAFHYDRSKQSVDLEFLCFSSPVPAWVRSYFAAHSLPSSMKAMHAAALACVSDEGKVQWPERLETPRVKRLLEENAQHLQQYAIHSQQWQPVTEETSQKQSSSSQRGVAESPALKQPDCPETKATRQLRSRPIDLLHPRSADAQVHLETLLQSSHHASCPLPSLSTIVVLTGFPEVCSTAAAAVYTGGLVWREHCWRESRYRNDLNPMPDVCQTCELLGGTTRPCLARPMFRPYVGQSHRSALLHSNERQSLPEAALSQMFISVRKQNTLREPEWSCECRGFPAFATANAFRWSLLLLGSKGLSSASCCCCLSERGHSSVELDRLSHGLRGGRQGAGAEPPCVRSVLSGLACGHPALRQAAVFGVTSRLKVLPHRTIKKNSVWHPLWRRGPSRRDE